jgi:hypothetical protein
MVRNKTHAPERIVAKLRQAEVLVAQGLCLVTTRP